MAGSGDVPGVIAGLGETGSREDTALVMPFLKSEQPAVLKAAITAIVKTPGNRVFMRFPGVFVYLWFQAFFGREPYWD